MQPNFAPDNQILLAFLAHLRTERTPLSLRKGNATPIWEDRERHSEFYESDPGLYALLAVEPGVTEAQRSRMLLQLLAASRAQLPAGARHIQERVVATLLMALPADTVLQAFLTLRRLRANHRHTTRAIAGYLLNHPDAAALMAHRRPAVADCLEHALGKNTARGAIRTLARSDHNGRGSARPLLRYAGQTERATSLAPTLYAPPLGIGRLIPAPDATYADAHAACAQWLAAHWERPATITATNRGELAATLIHLYRGGEVAPVRAALEQSLDAAVAELPRFAGRLALVLDLSASTRSYGDREYCCLSQSVALAMALARVCPDLHIYRVGGAGAAALPQPEGETDLACGLLEALECDPDLVAIVSDGYENRIEGDLARVTAALPGAGVTTPVVFCHSKFTNQDDLTFRRPASGIPQLEFWHQRDFAPLLTDLFLRSRGDHGRASLREYLVQRLDRLEQEGALWTA
jgi:hypothetical protein